MFKLFNEKTLLTIALLLPMCCVMWNARSTQKTPQELVDCVRNAGYGESCIKLKDGRAWTGTGTVDGECNGVIDKYTACKNGNSLQV